MSVKKKHHPTPMGTQSHEMELDDCEDGYAPPCPHCNGVRWYPSGECYGCMERDGECGCESCKRSVAAAMANDAFPVQPWYRDFVMSQGWGRRLDDREIYEKVCAFCNCLGASSPRVFDADGFCGGDNCEDCAACGNYREFNVIKSLDDHCN